METTQTTTPPAPGHLAYLAGNREAFDRGGEIYIAPRGAELDTWGRPMGARWECSRAHWDHFVGRGVWQVEKETLGVVIERGTSAFTVGND